MSKTYLDLLKEASENDRLRELMNDEVEYQELDSIFQLKLDDMLGIIRFAIVSGEESNRSTWESFANGLDKADHEYLDKEIDIFRNLLQRFQKEHNCL